MSDWSPHCVRCGRFVEYGADSSTPFGSYLDFEPPDPEDYCGPCAIQLEEEAVRSGHLPTNWIPADWERRAGKRLGFVLAGPRGTAWAHWYRPDLVPTGYREYAAARSAG